MPELSTALRLYRSLAPAASALTGLVAPFSAKLRTGLAGRRELMTRLTAAADGLQGCIWVHVTSVGEYEQARPIIAAIAARAAASQPPVAVTHFSPSGYDFALKRPCADLQVRLLAQSGTGRRGARRTGFPARRRLATAVLSPAPAGPLTFSRCFRSLHPHRRLHSG